MLCIEMCVCDDSLLCCIGCEILEPDNVHVLPVLMSREVPKALKIPELYVTALARLGVAAS